MSVCSCLHVDAVYQRNKNYLFARVHTRKRLHKQTIFSSPKFNQTDTPICPHSHKKRVGQTIFSPPKFIRQDPVLGLVGVKICMGRTLLYLPNQVRPLLKQPFSYVILVRVNSTAFFFQRRFEGKTNQIPCINCQVFW